MVNQAASDTTLPRVIGDFRLLDEIGRGGMGIVYLAEQLSLGRRVALKLLPAARAIDARYQERFEREIRVLARLQHPHIVRLYDAGEAEGQPYLVMELVAGVSLGEAVASLRDRGSVVVEDAVAAAGGSARSIFAARASPRGQVAVVAEMFAKLCDALAHAHAQGVVHRDIKPANILVDRAGEPRLLDFGLSGLLDGAPISEIGDLMGTPMYMSPEQLLAGRIPVDARTDIYSLGATLYEALAGQPPFRGTGLSDLFRQIQWDEPVPVRRIDPALPRDLELVVATAMAKNPEHRYPRAADFGADLRRVLAFDPVAGRGTSAWTRAARRLRKHRVRVGLAALVTLVAGGGSAHLLTAWSREARVLATERERARGEYHELVGRAQAALEATDLRGAAVTLDLLGTRSAPSTDAAALRDELAGLLRQRVEEALEQARVALAKGEPERAKGLLDTLSAEHLGAAGQALRRQAQEAIADQRAVRLLRGPSEQDRRLGITSWLADRKAGREIAPGRAMAFAELLETGSGAVLEDALRAVVDTGFEAFDEQLRRRFTGAPPEVALRIAAAAVAAQRADWRPVFEHRQDELCATDGRMSVSDLFDRSDWAAGPGLLAWQRDYHESGGGGTGLSTTRGAALALGLLLGTTGIRDRALTLLAKSGGRDDSQAVALLVLGEIDDPADAKALASLVSETWGLWELSRAARMLARWRHPQALTTLDMALACERDRALHADGLPYTAGFVVEQVGGEAALVWVRRLCQDGVADDSIKMAAALALLGDSIQTSEFAEGPRACWRRREEIPRSTVEAWLPARLRDALARGLGKLIFEGQTIPRRDVRPVVAYTGGASVMPPLWSRQRVAWVGEVVQHRPPDAVARLVPLLADPCWPVRWHAACGLIELDAPHLARGVLEDAALSDAGAPAQEVALAKLDAASGRPEQALARLRAVHAQWVIPRQALAGERWRALRSALQGPVEEKR